MTGSTSGAGRATDAGESPQKLRLNIDGFAGLLRDNDETHLLGDVLPFSELPKRAVRRLTELERGVVACLMGIGARLADGLGDTDCVLASRYGPMHHTRSLLESLAEGDLLSPTAFSLSVHNAALGAASQISMNHGGHTAVAAGEETLAAGLTECWARLSDGADQIVLVYSDLRLPGPYRDFEDETVDVQFACLMKLASPGGDAAHVKMGIGAAEALARALAGGAGQVEWQV